jgi:hypothetical protein
MDNNSQLGNQATNRQISPSRFVQRATLHPTQGAIGYVQVEAKKSDYRRLEPEKKRSFAEEHAVTVVLRPSGALHVIDHHHWARAWLDMGLPEAPIRIKEDFSALADEQFAGAMSKRAGCTLLMSTAGNSILPTYLAESGRFLTTYSRASPLSYESRAFSKTPENLMQSSHGLISSCSGSPPGRRPPRVLR